MACYHQTCDIWSPSWDLRGAADDIGLIREIAGALAGVAPGATLTPIRIAGWQRDRAAFPNYAAGSWGPKCADELMTRDGHRWHTS